MQSLVLAWLAAASLTGFAAGVVDKRRARRGSGRIPEAAFHALALLGGWPGELLAFLLVRHKVRKARFLVPFAVAAVASIPLAAVALGWRPG